MSATIKTALETQHSVKVGARVFAEWNQNMFQRNPVMTTFLDNEPREEDIVWDQTQVLKGRRPTGKLCGGVPGYTKVGNQFVITELWGTPRNVVIGPDSKYSHWRSNGFSDSFGGIPDDRVEVVYDSQFKTNKLVITFASWSKPRTFALNTTTDGTSWTWVGLVLSENMLDADGRLVLYSQSNGTWNTTYNIGSPVTIKGLQLVIPQIDRAGAPLGIIEISPRYMVDVTADLISYSFGYDISDVDELSPIGTASSNTGSVTLSNIGGRYSNDDPAAQFYGLIDENILFAIDKSIETSAGVEWVREGTMYSSKPSGTIDEEITFELKDDSKFLQEETCPNKLFQNVSAGKAIWQLLEAVGFNNWKYNAAAEFISPVMPFFWTTDDQTVWEVIQDVARANQVAVWFDQYNVLQITDYRYLFDYYQTPTWQIEGSKQGSRLPDLIEIDQIDDFHVNEVKIKYTPTDKSEELSPGYPKMEKVWAPDGTVVLRAAGVRRTLTPGINKFVYLDYSSTKYWPYEGIININGEYIRYKGKEFSWVAKNSSGTLYYKTVTVSSHEEYQELLSSARLLPDYTPSSTPNQSGSFTGGLYITERGLFNTAEVTHYVPADNMVPPGFTGSRHNIYGSGPGEHYSNTDFFYANAYNGGNLTVSMVTPDTDWANHHRQGIVNIPYDSSTTNYFGFRFKFDERFGQADGHFGFMPFMHPSLNLTWNRGAAMHFFSGSKDVADNWDRAAIWMTNFGNVLTGNHSIIPMTGPSEMSSLDANIWKMAIKNYQLLPGQWFDVEVYYRRGVQYDNLVATINGKPLFTGTTSVPVNSLIGSYGAAYPAFFINGQTSVQIDSFWAARITDDELITAYDRNMSAYDRFLGSFISSNYARPFVRRRRGKTPTFYYTDFGAVAHEAREFTVKHEPAPSIYTNLFQSNKAAIVEKDGTPFNTTFTLVNPGKKDIVLQGDDDTEYGRDETVRQTMMLFGRNVEQLEPQEHVVRDEDSVRRRGRVALEFSSPWIQSKKAAETIGQDIIDMWATPTEQLNVRVFGNPLIMIGQVVSIRYAKLNYGHATHKYYVFGAKHTIDETELVLRRIT